MCRRSRAPPGRDAHGMQGTAACDRCLPPHGLSPRPSRRARGRRRRRKGWCRFLRAGTAASRVAQALPRGRMTAGTSRSPGSRLGPAKQPAWCQAPSTSVLLDAALPVLVMCPLASLSSDECSEGISLHQLACSGAVGNLGRQSAFAARQNALISSVPLVQERARTVAAHLSLRASSLICFSSWRLSVPAHLTQAR